MRGLTTADLAEREGRALGVLALDVPGAPRWPVELAGDVVALVAELRWWREQYGAHPVPLMPAASGGRS